MVKIYLKSRSKLFEAVGLYNPDTNHVTVLKDAIISPTSTLISGKDKWIRLRDEHVLNGRLRESMEFNSPSAAATFVSGTSMNGYTRWKDKDGKALRSIKEKING